MVVRNIPPSFQLKKHRTRAELNLPEDKKIIILQGTGINVERGAEEAVLAMKFLENIVLLIVGSGDVLPVLKELVKQENFENKVIFKPKMPFEELRQYTMNADLGLALDKDTNINYRFSLPNKLFDFIHSGIPVLASQLPEIKHIIETYQIGFFIENHQPEHIAQQIRSIFDNKKEYVIAKSNTIRAKKELCWENEEQKLMRLIKTLD